MYDRERPALDRREECLLTAVLAEGQSMFGGAPWAAVGAAAQCGILGGTGGFHKARGDVMAVSLERPGSSAVRTRASSVS